MKKKMLKTLSVALSVLLVCGGGATVAYSAGVRKAAAETVPSADAVSDESDAKDSLSGMLTGMLADLGGSESTADVRKDETVYVIAGADGSVQKVIVSDWLKNAAGLNQITDDTTLENITNVKGDETYTMNGGTQRVWDAAGNDIYYQGESAAQLPVSLTVTYQLDGKTVSAEELEGKSGKVTIRFDYTNNLMQTVQLGDTEETLPVPFLMMSGLLLDSDSFRNITVSNGKLLNDGSHSAVIGIAFPGLQEDLALDGASLEIPDYLEITADVTGFTMPDTLTMATSEPFAALNLTSVDSLDDLGGAMTQLSDAMTALLDGSSQLYDGMSSLLSKSTQLAAGVDQLAAGAQKLADGTASLKGYTAEMASGMVTLNEGLQTLSGNNSALTSGAGAVFDSLLKVVENQITSAGLSVPILTRSNYGAVINAAVTSLEDSANVRAMAEAKARETVATLVNATVRSTVLSTVLLAHGISKDDYNALPADQKEAIDAEVSSQMNTRLIQRTTAALIDEMMQSDAIQEQIEAGIATATAGITSLREAKQQLDSYATFYEGILTYTAGVQSAADGAGKLADGSQQIADGTKTLDSGAQTVNKGLATLRQNMTALLSGISTLNDGAMQLSDGLKQFNDEGIQKLLSAFGGDSDQLLARMKAVSDMAKSYQSFAGKADDMEGSVKFIYKTQSAS